MEGAHELSFPTETGALLVGLQRSLKNQLERTEGTRAASG